MVPGLDSSFDAPTIEQAKQAYAAGVRVWGGYFGSRDGLGLAVRWNRMSFWNVQQAGMTAIGFCSGWDDPAWIRDTAAAWGILACADVERGIRDAGPWMQGWLDASGAGLYGLGRIHAGVRAAFHIMSLYPGSDPGATWWSAIAQPTGPVGWQWWGDHREFGLSVDRGNYDDWFARGGDMTDDERRAQIFDWYCIYAGRAPISDADRAEIENRWLPAHRANAFQARFDFGLAAAAEVPGEDVLPARKLDLVAAIAKLPTASGAVADHTHSQPAGPSVTGGVVRGA